MYRLQAGPNAGCSNMGPSSKAWWLTLLNFCWPMWCHLQERNTAKHSNQIGERVGRTVNVPVCTHCSWSSVPLCLSWTSAPKDESQPPGCIPWSEPQALPRHYCSPRKPAVWKLGAYSGSESQASLWLETEGFEVCPRHMFSWLLFPDEPVAVQATTVSAFIQAVSFRTCVGNRSYSNKGFSSSCLLWNHIMQPEGSSWSRFPWKGNDCAQPPVLSVQI